MKTFCVPSPFFTLLERTQNSFTELTEKNWNCWFDANCLAPSCQGISLASCCVSAFERAETNISLDSSTPPIARRLRRARQLAWICLSTLSNYMKGSVIWLLNLAVTVVYINPCLSWNAQIYSHNKQAQEGAQKFPTSAVIFLAYLSNYWIANLKKSWLDLHTKLSQEIPNTC